MAPGSNKGCHSMSYPKIIENEHGRFAICRVSRGKFMVAKFNPHHKNWVRVNKTEGMAFHQNLNVLVNDNLKGGPHTVSLNEAEEMVNCGCIH